MKKEMALGLEGIKVVETAAAIGGPMAGRLLADRGSDVIKVEHPIRAEMLRSINRENIRLGGRRIAADIDYRALHYNRNKRGMTLDLSQERGREIIYKLLAEADVFLSSYRPRDLQKFKLEYDTLSRLNHKLICANLSGHGRKGPDRNLPGLEHTSYFARAGIFHVLSMPGAPPPQNPIGFGDNISGLVLIYAIMTALFVRERTGIGQEVDVSLFSAGLFAISYDIAGALVTGQDRQAIERKDLLNALHNAYQTKDGRWLRLGLSSPDPYWTRFCQAIGREDLEHDPRFELFEPRIENHVALFNIVEEVILSKTLDEWKVRFDEAGLLWAPIQNLPEVIADPQARANDFFVSYDHPSHGRIEVVANPAWMSKTPATIRMPAPEFGQHTEEILLEYGYTWDDIEQFKEQGVIA